MENDSMPPGTSHSPYFSRKLQRESVQKGTKGRVVKICLLLEGHTFLFLNCPPNNLNSLLSLVCAKGLHGNSSLSCAIFLISDLFFLCLDHQDT